MLLATNVRAYIGRVLLDLRKSIYGLSYLTRPLLAQNPVSGHLFALVARDRSPPDKLPPRDILNPLRQALNAERYSLYRVIDKYSTIRNTSSTYIDT